MTGSYIPYGAYWSSPFSRWQGSLQHLPSVDFAAYLARTSLESRGIATDVPANIEFRWSVQDVIGNFSEATVTAALGQCP